MIKPSSSIFSRILSLFGGRRVESRTSLTWNNIAAMLGAGSRSNAGVVVNVKSALEVSPVWQAVQLITGDIARIPLHVYEDRGDSGRERATSHPVYRLLRRNMGETTPNIWISRVLGHALLYGNAYTRVYRSTRDASIARLEWLHYDDVRPRIEDGRRFYLVQYTEDRHGRSGVERVASDDMIHLMGLTLDELGGLSLIEYARNSIGRHIGAESYADDFFANDATPSGWYEHPGEMSEAAMKRFLESVARRHSGSGNRFKNGVLEEGMTYKAAGVTPSDAMLLDQMRWGVKDVSRFFNIPPHKLGDSDKVAYRSLEEENRAYFDSSLGIWVSKLEFEINDKLFHEQSESNLYAEFLQDAWNKASTEARFKSYAIALQWGIMNRNEVRRRENLNPVEGGDEFPPMPQLGGAPQSAQPTDDSQVDEIDDPVDDEPAPRSTQADIIRRDIVAERLQDAFRLIGNASMRAAKRPGNFLASVNDLETRFAQQVRGKIQTAVRSSLGEERIDDVASAIFTRCVDNLLIASECPSDQLVGRVTDTVASWQSQAADMATELVFSKSKV